MKLQTYAPSDRLKPYIRWFVISETSEEQTYKVLPDTSLVMGFQYRGRLAYLDKTDEIPLAVSGITGLQTTFRVFKNSPAIGSVLVVFTETGAASFFNEPIHELFGQSVALDNFTSRSALDSVQDQLATATNDLARIQIVEQFLLSRLQEHRTDPLVTLAVQHIYQSGGTIRMTTLMDKLCISQSPLEKRFRQQVGASPKKFASIVRMKKAIQLLAGSDLLTQVSIEAGYFDQAHFSNELKHFTGLTPSEYIQNSATH